MLYSALYSKIIDQVGNSTVFYLTGATSSSIYSYIVWNIAHIPGRKRGKAVYGVPLLYCGLHIGIATYLAAKEKNEVGPPPRQNGGVVHCGVGIAFGFIPRSEFDTSWW